MDIAKVIGNNIEKVIRTSEMNYEEVANLIGVTRQTLSNYINGQTAIDSAKLFKLSKFFNVSIKSFLNESSDKFCFMFRADNPLKNFSVIDYNFITNLFNNYFEVLKLIGNDKLIVIPESYKLSIKKKIEVSDEILIKEIAENERRNLEFNRSSLRNFYELLERRNINIIALSYDNLDLDAISAYSPEKGAFIFINDHKDIPEERKLFSLIHEYGHLLFHRDLYTEGEQDELAYSTSRKNIHEKVANKFASYFLIPRDALKAACRVYRNYIDIRGILNLKHQFGVSAKCILLALKDEKIITSSIYGFLNNNLNKSGFQYAEPNPLPYEENKNQRLRYILKELYLKDKITANKISEVLNLDNSETRAILKEWVING